MYVLKTNLGDLKFELYADAAPETVKNFLSYVADGFYKDTIFHRVIPGFMVQGGGFDTGFKQKPTKAPIKNEADNRLPNKIGSMAMARTSDPNSATCQFFINTANNGFLDFKAPNPQGYGYCVFGQVVDGLDVLAQIEKVRTSTRGYHQDVPVDNVVILDIVEA